MERRQRYKRIVIVTGTFLMCLIITACSSQKSAKLMERNQGKFEIKSNFSEGKEYPKATQVTGWNLFESPEGTVKAYLEGLKANDLKKMMETFAPEGNIDDILQQYAMLSDMPLNSDEPLPLEGTEDVEQFLKQITEQMKDENFESLKLLGFIPPELLSDIYGSDAHQKNMDKQAEKYGGEKLKSCVAAVEIGKKKYLLMFEVLEREGKWFNLRLGGILAKMSGIDGIVAGTLPLDAEGEEAIKKLIDNTSKDLIKSDTEIENKEKNATSKNESEGFDSPQEAAKAYLEGVKVNKPDQVLSTFAVESYVNQYNLQAYLEDVGAYVFLRQEYNLPAVNEFSRDLNIQYRKKQILDDILKQYVAFSSIKGVNQGDDIIKGEGEKNTSSSLTEMSNQLNISSINVLGYISPEKVTEMYNLKESLSVRDRQAEICGAKKMDSSVIVFELEGNKYCLISDAVEYNGKWYNKKLGGHLSSLLGLSPDSAGIMPFQALNDLEAEDFITPIS